jgi:glycosyltransferase involved in cell wall biosynthesis
VSISRFALARERGTEAPPGSEDLICFCHLRWNFVYQRPQHLLTRFARRRRVFFVEEAHFDADSPRLTTTRDGSGVVVAVPHLPRELPADAMNRALGELVGQLFAVYGIERYVLWYYTPMALGFTSHLTPITTVYDCMDELSAFAQAPVGIVDAERELMRRADIMLTGGHTLFEAKRHLHANVHAVPSSVDVAHFGRARRISDEPDDQVAIARPRLGFFGVLDERLDIDLLDAAAALRPDWQFVLIGPIVKIDPASLPRRANIHYLGAKSYDQLPEYIAGWDVALLPFARNDATRFISPTKTPEYLAAGRPVVSTSIRDVVRPYGEQGLARIADTPEAFVAGIADALAEPAGPRLANADAFLARMSWDATWAFVDDLVQRAGAARPPAGPVLPLDRLGEDQGSCSTTSL